MIKIENGYLYRGGEKIGRIEDNDIYEHGGGRLGYFEGTKIYDQTGKEIGRVDGNHIEVPHDTKVIDLEDNRQTIVGGTYSDVARAAIRLLLGE